MWSMEYSSMVSFAAFGPGDPGSNPGCFLSQIQIENLIFLHE